MPATTPPAAFVGTGGRLRSECMVAFNRNPWPQSLGIRSPQPNHAWRHLFKSMARHVGMDREVEGFITGHSSGKTSADYGPRWTKTLAKEVAKYPRFRIAALAQSPAPHKRTRRTRAQIEADNATREALRTRSRAA